MARRTPTTPGIVSIALTLLGQASWRLLRRRLPSWPAFFCKTGDADAGA